MDRRNNLGTRRYWKAQFYKYADAHDNCLRQINQLDRTSPLYWEYLSRLSGYRYRMGRVLNYYREIKGWRS